MVKPDDAVGEGCFDSIEQALEDIAKGKFVIVVDEVDRENEGDLVIAGEKITVEKMTFLLQHTTGIVCASLDSHRLQQLDIPVISDNQCHYNTPFTLSVDAAQGITTGVSAADRTRTVELLSNPCSRPEDFVRPGHFFPLVSAPGGVLKRAGHTEAALDLMRLAHMQPCGVLAELVNEDHTMMRLPQILEFAKKHSLSVISITDLIAHRMLSEKLINHVSSARLPTEYGEFDIHVYESVLDGVQHIALVKGDVRGKQDVLVRVHSECLTGDILGSSRCDCGKQLQLAMEFISLEGQGVIVYLRGQEGRGIGLGHKVRAYALQDRGYDTVDANLELGFPIDSRDYGIGAQILFDLGLTTIRLITHNPHKYYGLQGFGLKIVDRIALPIHMSEDNAYYLRTKKERLGHWLDFPPT
ncbi:bifunctional 3,4-dihydroxy-2-butanone-4-phosphate synthase/GTP cyclohydrolase II [Chlamydia gallinacea]|uniref:Riboflavin biosynthesis protein RibBA n=2 Tax=Chlamydia gallinacea TaxID=1457153 RepID=A0A173DYG7_9CHLA|nr:bifunctional 3,4-dihydroxy-2-butanone-4-phosphate synthase/GTP cyclohydrolase II [Chlamydia gallinacea]ANG65960.1 bifunctional 3,4-dihydroxy-2-butanone 4-phosphate synthase/GTP cyclohydrolase II [Chlamydia gallinacea 08-1274/3]AQT77951.1 bifunctional 3,4-dihydroxy-2-butanone 4-phosphate synthase/GTP cyclohydrolase II [Chlamydia gallinacea]MBX6680129.1 bifunctional 3,4-dihydroxy-2-butanone-4-phosphate synthase/GTP cyclohydrolase II [Chlamydia gallinacea]MBX6687361.1 bifunctional 3,4-dihydroxy